MPGGRIGGRIGGPGRLATFLGGGGIPNLPGDGGLMGGGGRCPGAICGGGGGPICEGTGGPSCMGSLIIGGGPASRIYFENSS